MHRTYTKNISKGFRKKWNSNCSRKSIKSKERMMSIWRRFKENEKSKKKDAEKQGDLRKMRKKWLDEDRLIANKSKSKTDKRD